MLLYFGFLISNVFLNACGQTQCQEQCPSRCSTGADHLSPLCNCDADCGVFGDCCGSTDPPELCESSVLSPLEPGVTLECQSIFLVDGIPAQGPGDGFYMVTSCPTSWLEERSLIFANTVAENCGSQDIGLPPVTDTLTGMVYRNEHCAICNGRDQLRAWDVTLACNPNVYLALTELRITLIYEGDPGFFLRECQGCVYQAPLLSVSPPRSCTPSIRSCLSKDSLELQLMRDVPDALYLKFVMDCLSGPQDLMLTTDNIIFYNQACGMCSGAQELSCFHLTSRTALPNECIPTREEFIGGHFLQKRFLSTTAPMLRDGRSTVFPNEDAETFPPVSESPEFTIPFPIIITYFSGSLVTINAERQSVTVPSMCLDQQVQVGLECYATLCPEAYTEAGGRCILNESVAIPSLNTTSFNCTLGIQAIEDLVADFSVNVTLHQEDEVAEMERGEFSEHLLCMNRSSTSLVSEFLKECPIEQLLLESTRFEERSNGKLSYDKGKVEILSYNRLGNFLLCLHDTQSNITTANRDLPLGIKELSYTGSSISILGNILILVTYYVLRDLRKIFPSVLLLNLSASILVTNSLFIIGVPVIQQYPIQDLCVAVAACLHFSYLAQFTWVSLFSLEMARTFNLVRKQAMDSETVRKKCCMLLVYMLVGWCIPLAISIVAVALNFSGTGLVLYGRASDSGFASCWINDFVSFIIFLLTPLALSMVISLSMLVVVAIILAFSSRNGVQQSDLFLLVRLWLVLLLTSVLSWVFGFLAISYKISWAWYPFVILSSTQGVSIFVILFLSKNTIVLYKALFASKKRDALTTHPWISSGGDNSRAAVYETESSFIMRDVQSEERGATPPVPPPRRGSTLPNQPPWILNSQDSTSSL